MKKFRKLSLDRSRTVGAKEKVSVVFLYGPQAVGKLTIAKILAKKLKYKLAHNHHVNDFVTEVFDRSSFEAHWMKDNLRYLLLEHMVKARNNFIVTHCYSHNFVSQTGLSDPEYVKTLARKLTKLGAKFYPVHLKASKEELLRRVSMSSRREFHKLKNKKIMRELALKHDWQTSPKLKNNLIIDNTHILPQKVANMIIKHFKLK